MLPLFVAGCYVTTQLTSISEIIDVHLIAKAYSLLFLMLSITVMISLPFSGMLSQLLNLDGVVNNLPVKVSFCIKLNNITYKGTKLQTTFLLDGVWSVLHVENNFFSLNIIVS